MQNRAEKQNAPGVFGTAAGAAEKVANAHREEADGVVQYHYPDYETYRKVQSEGNKAKLCAQFVKQSHIHALADHLNETYGPITFGLCHGVRRGKEQKWFQRRLSGRPEMIGTDISDTASSFPMTVQWDFHDENPEWQGRADFVYTNSWDHAFDPERAFKAWYNTLKSGGLLLLDHTPGHMPTSASALDPFGATWDALAARIHGVLGDSVQQMTPLERLDDPDYQARTMILRRV